MTFLDKQINGISSDVLLSLYYILYMQGAAKNFNSSNY